MIVEERETKSDGSAEDASNRIDNKWLVNRSNQALGAYLRPYKDLCRRQT